VVGETVILGGVISRLEMFLHADKKKTNTAAGAGGMFLNVKSRIQHSW